MPTGRPIFRLREVYLPQVEADTKCKYFQKKFIYPKELKSGSWRGTITVMFISALFTTARMWKELKFPWVGESEKAMAPHSSTLAWKIPWTEEPGRLQSMGSRRVGHDWATSLSLFHFHALEKEMATHSSVLAWRTPGTAEPGGLPSMGSHRVGHDWSDLAAAAAALVYSLCPCICASRSRAAVTGSCPHHKQEDRSGSEKGRGH